MTTENISSGEPKISLITVCWNAESTIVDTLRSIDTQTFRNFEHIVIDGKSTDSTLALVNSCSADNRIVVSEADKGIYDAMNKGISRARGNIIGFLNADDQFAAPDTLDKIAHGFEVSNAECLFGNLVYVSRDNPKRIIRFWEATDFNPGSFGRGWFPPHPTFYAHKSVYEKLGSFDLSYRYAADVELMMRFLEVGRISSHRLPDVLVNMKIGGESNSGVKRVLAQNAEVFRALESHKIPFSRMSYWIWKITNRLVQFLRGAGS